MSDTGLISQIRGLPELKAALLGIPEKLRFRALRNALAAGGRVVQKEVRRLTPVLKINTKGGRYAYRKGLRKPGTVQRAVSVRASRLAKARGDVGVFINVRPAKGSARGAKSYKDPFYWRWIDKGWNPAGGDRSKAGKRARRALNVHGVAKRVPGLLFIRGGVAKLDDALRVFLAKIGPAIQKLNQPKAPPP